MFTNSHLQKLTCSQASFSTSPLFDAARRARVDLSGRPSSRQVQNGTGRKAGQKRRALACAAAPEPRAENRRLPVFEHGEEPPFDAPEHRGTCPCFLPCRWCRFSGDRAFPTDCFRLKAKRRAAERGACLSLALRVTGEWFTPFRACPLCRYHTGSSRPRGAPALIHRPPLFYCSTVPLFLPESDS